MMHQPIPREKDEGFFPKLFNLKVMSPHTFWVISVLGERSDVAVQGGRLHGA